MYVNECIEIEGQRKIAHVGKGVVVMGGRGSAAGGDDCSSFGGSGCGGDSSRLGWGSCDGVEPGLSRLRASGVQMSRRIVRTPKSAHLVRRRQRGTWLSFDGLRRNCLPFRASHSADMAGLFYA